MKNFRSILFYFFIEREKQYTYMLLNGLRKKKLQVLGYNSFLFIILTRIKIGL